MEKKYFFRFDKTFGSLRSSATNMRERLHTIKKNKNSKSALLERSVVILMLFAFIIIANN